MQLAGWSSTGAALGLQALPHLGRALRSASVRGYQSWATVDPKEISGAKPATLYNLGEGGLVHPHPVAPMWG